MEAVNFCQPENTTHMACRIPKEVSVMENEKREHVRNDTRKMRQTHRPHHQRSLLELKGLGAEIWDGIEAQEEVNKLRDEWEENIKL